MTYLSVAEEIYNWLARFQINQRYIHAECHNDSLTFNFEHPVEGKIEIIQPFQNEQYFRCKGIGLKFVQKDNNIAKFDVYDYGGIFDPIDYFVPGDHYATTHFALLGAILYHKYQNEELLANVKKAITFHLTTSKEEYHHFDIPDYHWDFQNYAFVETYCLLKSVLTNEENRLWIQGLKSWKENTDNALSNWIAMRSYSALLRSDLLNHRMDKLKYWLRLRALNKARHSDGCYDDYFNKSRPIQYHVFTLALLHRIFLHTQNERIKEDFLSGVNYFTKFIDPDGCFNFLGRGQEQIFGYAVGLYVLEAAKKLDVAEVGLYQYHIDNMWNYLLSFKRDDHFPLVLNHHQDEERFGWYDYHHLTVYNAFLGVWLGFSYLLASSQKSEKKIKANPSRISCQFFKPTQSVIVSKEKYYLALTGGTVEYLSETGVTPVHIWFKNVGWVFTCPGGPTKNEYGKVHVVENIEKNVLAPLAKQKNSVWILPAYRESKIVEANEDSIQVIHDYEIFILNRTIELHDDAILFCDQFHFRQNGILEELRYCNIPIVSDKFEIDTQSPGQVKLKTNRGSVVYRVIDTNFASQNFAVMEEVKTTKGLASIISLQEKNFELKRNQKNHLKYSLGIIN